MKIKIYVVVVSWFDIDGQCSTNSYVSAFQSKDEAEKFVEECELRDTSKFNDYEIFDTELDLSPDESNSRAGGAFTKESSISKT